MTLTRPMLSHCIYRKQDSFSADVKKAFEAYFLEANGKDEELTYDLPYPKHAFLTYLTESKGLLVHGSPVQPYDLIWYYDVGNAPLISSCKFI